MENELISVIVPIYNVENYLRMCLDSIQNQTYKNFECLLINDGSPDNSAEICREYAAKDSRFRYFEKENGGVSSARNLGIERSEGVYITFVDSDNWVEPDYLEVLYSIIVQEKADISVSTYKQFNTKENCWYLHSFQRGYEKRVFKNDELINELIDLNVFDSSYGFASCKLVRKDSIGCIRFNTSTSFCEDMEFWFKLYLIVQKIVYINRDSYNYRTDINAARYFTPEKIRSDVEQHLKFITFLAVKNFNIGKYIENFIEHLKYSKYILLESVGMESSTDTLRWIEELLYLLEISHKM